MKNLIGLLTVKEKEMDETTGDTTLAFNITPETPTIRFLASLSDGRTVIQDDRSSDKDRHAWIRLSMWLKENPGILITELRLQGPKGFEAKMPSNQKGYFFSNKLQAVWKGPQSNSVGIGYYDGYKVNVCWYKKPMLDSLFSEEKTVAEAGFFLIENK